MPGFFRKLRHSLPDSRQTGRYLLYALGEITLVVIGILIAVSLNNANEQQHIRSTEQTYLTGLLNDFEISRKKLDALIAVNRENTQGAHWIVGQVNADGPLPSEPEFSRVLFQTFARDVAFNPNLSLLQEMIHSGYLKNISHGGLRVRLTDWVSSIEDIDRQEHELDVQREKVLDMFRSDQNSLRTILEHTGLTDSLHLLRRRHPASNLDLLHSTAFENNVLMFILSGQAMEANHYQPLMADLKAILELLRHEVSPDGR